MASKDTFVANRGKGSGDPSHADDATEQRQNGERHSDVVPKDFSQVMAALRGTGSTALRPGALPHLTWQETGLRVPDETRSAWMNAYESGFDQAFSTCARGDWLVPLVYAAGKNDERLGGAFVRFAYEVALGLPDVPEADTESAFAVLEVAQATLEGGIGKDLCARIAANLVDEAYARFEAERRFDRYFFAHCAAAVARLAANVSQPSSARDAVDAVQSAVAALRVQNPEAEQSTLALAARCIREALTDASDVATNTRDTAPD